MCALSRRALEATGRYVCIVVPETAQRTGEGMKGGRVPNPRWFSLVDPQTLVAAGGLEAAMWEGALEERALEPSRPNPRQSPRPQLNKRNPCLRMVHRARCSANRCGPGPAGLFTACGLEL
ncbi:hypothetical protein PoB_001356400 [Plakobranchus ocellatus]|uniref:Uncharacterized protein n=1 Tax=Plakobranchus ocellatus TaxID=259542 RepID=A0AAV3YVG4_9GAST|nr:hypothetical protein PoB_001356400 [Plakobranchus ocellatus]